MAKVFPCESWKLVFDCIVFEPLDCVDIRVMSWLPPEVDVLRGLFVW